MFSTSLRSHPVWSTTLSSLRTHPGLRLWETTLDGHDIAIAIPPSAAGDHANTAPHRNITAAGGTSRAKRVFRFLLLTPEDIPCRAFSASTHGDMSSRADVTHANGAAVTPSRAMKEMGEAPERETDARQTSVVADEADLSARETLLKEKLGRFLGLTSGVDVALIFLLCGAEESVSGGGGGSLGGSGSCIGSGIGLPPNGQKNDTKDTHQDAQVKENGMHALMQLQVMLLDLFPGSIAPILPLSSPPSLPLLLQTFLAPIRYSHVAPPAFPTLPTPSLRPDHNTTSNERHLTQHHLSGGPSTHTPPQQLFSSMLKSCIPALSEQTLNILSDVFEDNLAALASTCATERGRAFVKGWIDQPGEAESVIRFFLDEEWE